MSVAAKIVSSLAATAGSATVLATVRSGWLDAVDGAVLVASLALLGRTVIRSASEPGGTRRRGS